VGASDFRLVACFFFAGAIIYPQYEARNPWPGFPLFIYSPAMDFVSGEAEVV
jgi:hypothetical protein